MAKARLLFAMVAIGALAGIVIGGATVLLGGQSGQGTPSGPATASGTAGVTASGATAGPTPAAETGGDSTATAATGPATAAEPVTPRLSVVAPTTATPRLAVDSPGCVGGDYPDDSSPQGVVASYDGDGLLLEPASVTDEAWFQSGQRTGEAGWEVYIRDPETGEVVYLVVYAYDSADAPVLRAARSGRGGERAYAVDGRYLIRREPTADGGGGQADMRRILTGFACVTGDDVYNAG